MPQFPNKMPPGGTQIGKSALVTAATWSCRWADFDMSIRYTTLGATLGDSNPKYADREIAIC